MPDLHRLPFYALAGTQDAITLTQVITSPRWRVGVRIGEHFGVRAVVAGGCYELCELACSSTVVPFAHCAFCC